MRFFKVVTVLAVLILYPAQANANAVLPWFDTSELESSISEATKSPQPAANTKKPKKRMLAMSIGHSGTSSQIQPRLSQSSGCTLAVLISLLGLVGIGTLTRTDPLSESEKVI